MPVGPVTVGATYADGNGKAKEVAAAYNFSKRTSLAVAYRDVTDNSVAAKNVATTRVRLQHKF
jgi:predicted porin